MEINLQLSREMPLAVFQRKQEMKMIVKGAERDIEEKKIVEKQLSENTSEGEEQ